MEMIKFMNPKATVTEVTEAAKAAASEGKELILVPQWFVSTAAEALAGTGTVAATIVGLPGGTTSSFAKFAEAKQAVANGAKIIIVPINMDLCAKGDIDGVKGDLQAALVAGKTKAAVQNKVKISALIDGEGLSAEKLGELAGQVSLPGLDKVFIAHAAALPANANVEAY
ncbi:MAG: hypothetical protein IJL97_03085 [Lachnospiraceae bacterium]|nr:hypothetical protein [Lachnospiraceae bacterium]